MTIVRNILSILARAFFFSVGFVLLYLACAFCLSRIAVGDDGGTAGDVAIYIRTNGVHTDIVVPTKNDLMDWSREVKFANTVSGDTACGYLAMGWGDKGFYLQTPQWSDLKFSVAFRAMFALSSTAIHATYYRSLTEDECCRKIMISRQQYAKLVDYIKSAFRTDGDGHFMHIVTNANYGGNDAFYEARGTYNLFRTCNTWANGALKAAGLRCCLWTPFDKGIFMKYSLPATGR